MLQFVVAAGVAYFLLRGASRREDNSQEDENLPDPGGIPTPEPKPDRPPVDGDVDGDGNVEFEEIYSWSGEAVVGDEVVWVFSSGIRREDGSVQMNADKVVIGNATHTEFLRQNARGGTINIKWEATGRSDKRDSKNVVVFASIEDAVAYLEEEDDDDDFPSREPEDDGSSPTRPLPPTQPGYGLGGGGMTPFQNGGI